MRRLIVPFVAAAVMLTACGGGGPTLEPQRSMPPSGWSSVEREARGQTVRWWMYGGDEQVNRYVDEFVKPAAAEAGVALERVPVSDTAEAVQRVIAERRAGVASGGSVDLIWINGENFVQGKQAGLWLEDWARTLPNARYVDWDDPTIAEDFGVPVEGQESPWSRAAFVFAYDEQRTPEPPRTYPELLDYARAHPGRVTYPAPPDFTGSAFVRQAVQTLGEDRAFALLEELKPLQWRQGEAFPGSEAELNRLFGDDAVDVTMSYDPSFVLTGVRQGLFPPSTRPFVFRNGTLQNVSYVTIPANAAHLAGAQVVANLLLSPELQAKKADPEILGIPTVLDLSRLHPTQRQLFTERADNACTLRQAQLGPYLAELPAGRVPELEDRWHREVLR